MIELALIGIGTGSPGHLTAAAAAAIGAADLILVPDKGADKADLADLRLDLCRSLAARPAGGAPPTTPGARIEMIALPERDPATPDYIARVIDWHDRIAALWQAAIRAHLDRGGGPRVALLVWGDPSLYDSSLRIARRVALALPLRITVHPGITAVQALCAAHAIALNDLAAPVLITTGRRLRAEGWPACADTVVVMLDAGCAFTTLDAPGLSIWWGAYLGLPQQMTEAGPLHEAGPRILTRRAAARAEHGWIMDTYLLRRG